MPQHFAQLSDPHLSSLEHARARDMLNKRALGYLSWRRKRRFEHRIEVLAALQRDLSGIELDQLLITGDLTHIGLPQEFEQALQWLQDLGDPRDVTLVPGNHDACVAAPWHKTFALWQEYMAADDERDATASAARFPTLRVRGSIAFIGLSTACPKPPLMATGTVDDDQLQRLPAVLKETGRLGLFRVVYLHHSPLQGKEKWRKRLTNAAQVQELLARHGAELALHGHGHREHYNELETCHGILPVIAVPSASALGLHGADTARYNRYHVQRKDGGWRVRVDSRHFLPELGEFGEGDSRVLELNR